MVSSPPQAVSGGTASLRNIPDLERRSPFRGVGKSPLAPLDPDQPAGLSEHKPAWSPPFDLEMERSYYDRNI